MDFKWRVIFSQLETLVLSDWCVAPNFSGIIYFVQHSPVLQSLTLGLEYYEVFAFEDLIIDFSLRFNHVLLFNFIKLFRLLHE
jgi:hypothetical protein